MSSVTVTYYHQHDQKRKSNQNYAKSPVRKKKCVRRKLDQIQKAWKAKVEDKEQGSTYQSQMAAPEVTRTETERNGGVQGASILFCKACVCYGHQQRTSKKCTQNPSSKLYQGTYVDSVRRLLVYVVSKYSYYILQ
jgi:hypothetical protein